MGLRATATIDRLTRTEYDRELKADVKRGYGYHAACTCGDDSGRKPTVSACRVWLRDHRETCAGVHEVRG